MRKIFFIFILLFLLLPSLVLAENLTLTTYYPSPFGVYDQLRLFPRAPLGTPCKIGTLYVTSPDGIQFCQDDGTGTGIWGHPSGIWDQLNDDIYLTDTSRNPNLAVGIGTIIPNSRLTIKGIGITNATASLNVLDNADTSILLIKDDGNIGLGTITPKSRLTIKGFGATGATSSLNVTDNADTSMLYVADDGNVGIGTETPDRKFTIYSDSILFPLLKLEAQNAGIELVSKSNTWEIASVGGAAPLGRFRIYDSTAGKEALTILPNTCQVGIGVMDPQYTLDVNGLGRFTFGVRIEAPRSLIFRNDPASRGWEIFQATGGDAPHSLQFRRYFMGGSITRVSFLPDGEVGIVDDDPTGLLSIARNSYAKDLFMIGSTESKDGDLFIVKNNGRIGIGRKGPTHPLHMASGAHVTNGGVWTDASSIKYKQDVAELTTPVAYETLKKLNPVTFRFKVDPEEKHAGFIAEDVPDLVATKDRKGLSPMDIVAILTKVAQDQQKTLKQQQKKIEQLEARFNNM